MTTGEVTDHWRADRRHHTASLSLVGGSTSGVCTMLDQQTHDGCVSTVVGHLHRRTPGVVGDIDVGVVRNQHPSQLYVLALACIEEWRAATLAIQNVDLCAPFQDALDSGTLA